MTLTKQQIERLASVDGKRVSISVGDGLTIRVHPSGRKSWVFRLYRDGRVIDETIGYWPEMGLKHARQAVREKRKRAALEPPAGFTLRDAFRLWCAVKKKSISSYSEERRRIERHVMSAVKGTNPLSACFMGIWFADKNAVPGAATTNANVLGAIEAAIRSDGTSDVKMYSNRNEAGTDDRAQIMVGWRFDSAGVLVPSTFLTNTVSMVGYETQRTYRVFRIEKDGDNADNFVISGANQTTFLCSGEIGYDDPEAAAVRAALRKSAEDVVIASDNRVVIASNCNSRDISQVKIAYLDSSGYFHLPVDPVSSSNDDSIPTTRWVNTKITESRPKAYITETFKSGTSWYRKWSDGFIEQGGYVDSPYAVTIKVTLHVNFSDTNYTVVLGVAGGSESTARVELDGKTTSYFSSRRYYSGSGQGSGKLYWEAKGY